VIIATIVAGGGYVILDKYVLTEQQSRLIEYDKKWAKGDPFFLKGVERKRELFLIQNMVADLFQVVGSHIENESTTYHRGGIRFRVRDGKRVVIDRDMLYYLQKSLNILTPQVVSHDEREVVIRWSDCSSG
jgi:hypothetical protein